MASLTSYDETARCASAFRILRQMVTAWLKDVTQHQNVFADFQIVHFYRWLRDPNSLLHDPALRRILHNLMNKLFLHLVSEFKRLGAVIIFANFNKLVICTKKRRVSDAITYVEYIVDAIHNKELFHSIDISFSKCWLYLSWHDLSNNGGIKGEVPNADKTQMNNTPALEDNEENSEALESGAAADDPVIEMNWNLADYLPEWCGAQSSFNNVVASYMLSVYEKIQEEEMEHPAGSTPVRRRCLSQLTPSNTAAAAKAGKLTPASQDKEEVHDANTLEHIKFARDLVRGELAQKLFFITQQLQKKGSKGKDEFDEEEEDRNMLIADVSKNMDRNPALEFVKSVCTVLGLDANVSDQVKLMKLKCNIFYLGSFQLFVTRYFEIIDNL